MKQQETEKPRVLAIDVEQWKRDIQTFAETTSRALNAIAEELSNDCSNNQFQESAALQESGAFGAEAQSPLSARIGESHNSDRLTQLKLKLAKRISSSD